MMQEYSQQYSNQQQLLEQIQAQAKKTRMQTAYLISGIIIFLFAAFLFFNLLFPKIAIKFISVDTEIRMGNQLFNGLQQEIKIDKNASAMLQNFVDQLHLSKQYPIKVSVAVADEVNAYALPGGHIVVNSAILRELKSPEALVALLCHETTHINNRHSLKNILSSLGSGFVISLFTNGGGSAAKLVVDNANFLLQMKYSRVLETEADAEGMRLMERNQIDPKGMMELMQTLQQTEDDNAIDRLPFLRSHPLTDERIAATKNYIQTHPFSEQSMNVLLVDYWTQIKFVAKDLEPAKED